MGGVRSAVSVALAVLAMACGVVAIGATWMHHQVMNETQWSDSSVKVLRDPAVQKITADFLADQTVDQLQSSAVASVLPEALRVIGSERIGDLAGQAALRALRDGTFETQWRTASATTHAQFVRWLHGQDTRIEGGKVVLDLQPVVDKLAQQLGVPTDLVKQAEAATGGATIVLLQRDEYEQTRHDVARLERLAVLTPLVALALALLSIVIAPRRRTAVVRIGIAAIGAGLIVLIASPLMRTSIEHGLIDGGAASSVARSIWSVTSPDLIRAGWLTAVAGAALAAAAALTRPRDGGRDRARPERGGRAARVYEPAPRAGTMPQRSATPLPPRPTARR